MRSRFGASIDWSAFDAAAAEYERVREKGIATIPTDVRVAPAIADGSGFDERILVRGSPKSLGAVARRRPLEAFCGPAPMPIGKGSGRKELADLLIDPKVNPLTPRVMVNRVWRHLIGRGIVSSVDNFGRLGETPTHPELLDHLACRFVERGWSVKKLIREIALSSVYRTGSSVDPSARNIDPENKLLHHRPLRRLDAEAIRDRLLTSSGRLDRSVGGPPIPIFLHEFQEGRGRPTSGPLDGAGRRSIYLSVRRNFPSAMLAAFDRPNPFSTVGRRTESNVPAQSLTMMNDPFVVEQSARLGAAIARSGESNDDRISRAFEATLQRRPSSEELDDCRRFYRSTTSWNEESGRNGANVEPWAELVHALFNSKEFIFVP